MTLPSIINEDAFSHVKLIDEELSKRFISLDPNGYFLIKLDVSSMELVVEHYANDIDSLGRAVDQETGEPIVCEGGQKRSPQTIYRGRSAKEVGIQLTEGSGQVPLSKLDHALYLGRELQKAEVCLLHSMPYIQD